VTETIQTETSTSKATKKDNGVCERELKTANGCTIKA